MWHGELLTRVQRMPSLRDLEGEPEDEIDEEAAAEARLDRLRLWKAALQASQGKPAHTETKEPE